MATEVVAQSELAARLWDAVLNRREIFVLGDMLVPSPFAPVETAQTRELAAAATAAGAERPPRSSG